MKNFTCTEFFQCQCSSDEHTLKFALDVYEGDDYNDLEIYTSVFLGDYPRFWERVWTAIKYVFGYKCKYGHFDCFTMRHQDVDRMMELCNKYKSLENQLKEKKNGGKQGQGSTSSDGTSDQASHQAVGTPQADC